MDATPQLLERALGAGFDLAGVAPLAPPPAAARFEAWLAAGRHADMAWLERQRPRIVDPRRVLPGGTRLLVVGLGHARDAARLPGGGRVARYAAGRDYHNWIGKRLRKLGRELERDGLVDPRWRSVVDAGPLLERSHAAAAGVGFESKAANLLHRDHGPWFFLGELLVDADAAPTDAPALGSCGTCTACLDACPTDAILEPGVVDARRCISYHTIENRGPVPHALRRAHGEWFFGCDVCSEVCPWGRKAPDASARFGTHPAVAETRLADWLTETDDAAFRARTEGSPLRRPGRVGLARNAALALGNAPDDAGREALERGLEDASPVVREAAFWGLAVGHGTDAGAAAALERARGREPDPDAGAGMERSLAERG